MSLVVFLDIDGVLNYNQSYDEDQLKNRVMPELVTKLNPLVPLGCDWVICSELRWRFGPIEFNTILRGHGFTGQVTSVTPRTYDSRQEQVLKHMQGLESSRKFVVFDDTVYYDDAINTDPKNKKARSLFVHVNARAGLTAEDVAKAQRFYAD